MPVSFSENDEGEMAKHLWNFIIKIAVIITTIILPQYLWTAFCETPNIKDISK